MEIFIARSRVKNLLTIEAQGIPLIVTVRQRDSGVLIRCLCPGMWSSLERNFSDTEMKNLKNFKIEVLGGPEKEKT